MTKRFWIVFSFLVLWTVLTTRAMTWESRFDWPDNVHIDYGFPLVWGTQTLSTIVGPVNVWNIEITAFIMDIAFWLAIMVIAVIFIFYFFNKKSLKEREK